MATTTDWCAAEAGLETSVKIRLATRNADGMKGCFESHVAAIAQGLKDTPQHCSKDNTQKQARFILVCEDDIEFKHRRGMTLEQALNTARRALASKQCEVVGIGGWAIRSFRDEIVPKCRLVKWNCAHCYLVSREAAEKIKEWKYVQPKTKSAYGVGSHWDQVMANQLRQAMIVPSPAFQRGFGVFNDEVTTTNTTSWVYFNIQRLRNLASPFLTQLFLEYLFYYCSWFP